VSASIRTHPAVCAGALLAAADGSGGWQRLPGRGENQNPLAIESNRHNHTLLAEEIIGRKTGNRSCTILPVDCRVGVERIRRGRFHQGRRSRVGNQSGDDRTIFRFWQVRDLRRSGHRSRGAGCRMGGSCPLRGSGRAVGCVGAATTRNFSRMCNRSLSGWAGRLQRPQPVTDAS